MAQSAWLKHREGRRGRLNGVRTPQYNCWSGFKWNRCSTKAEMPNNWPDTVAEELSVLHQVGQSHPSSYRKGGEQKINTEREEGWREWGGKAWRGLDLCPGDICHPGLVWRTWEATEGDVLELILTCASVTAVPAASPLSHWHRQWQQHWDALPDHTSNLPGCALRKISPTLNFYMHVGNVRDGHCLQQSLAQMAAAKPHSRKDYFL